MIRNIEENDYDYIIERLDEWWDGRKMSNMLPRLFFKHFNQSSFAFTDSGNVVGFLIGFPSDSAKGGAYVHFVGVDPRNRRDGIAAALYDSFFQYCRTNRIQTAKCVTSPANTASIRFHHSIGFRASEYDKSGNPVALSSYDGPGQDRILFAIEIGAWQMPAQR